MKTKPVSAGEPATLHAAHLSYTPFLVYFSIFFVLFLTTSSSDVISRPGKSSYAG
jgi:hypothetical protein